VEGVVAVVVILERLRSARRPLPLGELVRFVTDHEEFHGSTHRRTPEMLVRRALATIRGLGYEVVEEPWGLRLGPEQALETSRTVDLAPEELSVALHALAVVPAIADQTPLPAARTVEGSRAVGGSIMLPVTAIDAKRAAGREPVTLGSDSFEVDSVAVGPDGFAAITPAGERIPLAAPTRPRPPTRGRGRPSNLEVFRTASRVVTAVADPNVPWEAEDDLEWMDARQLGDSLGTPIDSSLGEVVVALSAGRVWLEDDEVGLRIVRLPGAAPPMLRINAGEGLLYALPLEALAALTPLWPRYLAEAIGLEQAETLRQRLGAFLSRFSVEFDAVICGQQLLAAAVDGNAVRLRIGERLHPPASVRLVFDLWRWWVRSGELALPASEVTEVVLDDEDPT
jgi:hypothetical protein